MLLAYIVLFLFPNEYGLLTKLARSSWLDIGQVIILGMFKDRDKDEGYKHAKEERGQYSAILTEQARSIKYLLFEA